MIIGNLTRDPELRTTTSGQSVVTMGVATSRVWTGADGKKQEKPEFHQVVAWGKLAEICSQYLAKGRKVYVEGRLQTREWEGQDGTKRNRTEIIAENLIMLSPPPQGGFPQRAPAPSAPEASDGESPSESQIAPLPSYNATEEIKIEDIPF